MAQAIARIKQNLDKVELHERLELIVENLHKMEIE